MQSNWIKALFSRSSSRRNGNSLPVEYQVECFIFHNYNTDWNNKNMIHWLTFKLANASRFTKLTFVNPAFMLVFHTCTILSIIFSKNWAHFCAKANGTSSYFEVIESWKFSKENAHHHKKGKLYINLPRLSHEKRAPSVVILPYCSIKNHRRSRTEKRSRNSVVILTVLLYKNG